MTRCYVCQRRETAAANRRTAANQELRAEADRLREELERARADLELLRELFDNPLALFGATLLVIALGTTASMILGKITGRPCE